VGRDDVVTRSLFTGGIDVQQSRRCSACSPTSELRNTAAWEAGQAELGPIEELAYQIQALTATLRAALPPDQFTLVWKLRDTVERLALAEEVLHERHLLDSLIRHLPRCAAAIHTTRQHLRGADVITEEPG